MRARLWHLPCFSSHRPESRWGGDSCWVLCSQGSIVCYLLSWPQDRVSVGSPSPAAPPGLPGTLLFHLLTCSWPLSLFWEADPCRLVSDYLCFQIFLKRLLDHQVQGFFIFKMTKLAQSRLHRALGCACCPHQHCQGQEHRVSWLLLVGFRALTVIMGHVAVAGEAPWVSPVLSPPTA